MKWEYKIIDVYRHEKQNDVMTRKLNEAGAEGWRAVHFDNGATLAIMEREIPEPPAPEGFPQ